MFLILVTNERKEWNQIFWGTFFLSLNYDGFPKPGYELFHSMNDVNK